MATAERSFKATCDGSEERYVCVEPEDFGSGGARDALVALHGHGSDRWQFIKEPRDECRAVREVAAANGMLLVSPDYRAPTSWMGPKAEADLVDLLGELRSRYRLRHIYLCGASMGGAASLIFAVLHPELLAGVASMNGVANLVEYEGFQDAIAASYGGTKQEKPEEYRKRSAELQAEKLSMPVGLTVSGNDTSTPPGSVRRLAAILRQRQARVLLIDRESEGHRTSYADAQAILHFIITPEGRESKRVT